MSLYNYIVGTDEPAAVAGAKESAKIDAMESNLMECKEIKYKSCTVRSLQHVLKGNNMDGKFYIIIAPPGHLASLYNSLSITTVEECEALVDCLVDLKGELAGGISNE